MLKLNIFSKQECPFFCVHSFVRNLQNIPDKNKYSRCLTYFRHSMIHVRIEFKFTLDLGRLALFIENRVEFKMLHSLQREYFLVRS